MLDVGTNVGYYTIMFAQLVGAEGRVLGIEASPRTYDLLSTTLEFNGLLSSHVQLLHRAALNVDNRTVQFTTATGRALNNRVKSSIPSGARDGRGAGGGQRGPGGWAARSSAGVWRCSGARLPRATPTR